MFPSDTLRIQSECTMISLVLHMSKLDVLVSNIGFAHGLKIQRAHWRKIIFYHKTRSHQETERYDINFEWIPREAIYVLRLAHLWNSKSLLITAMFPPNTQRTHSKYRSTSYLTFMIDHLTSRSHAHFRLGNLLHNQRKACKRSSKDSNQWWLRNGLKYWKQHGGMTGGEHYCEALHNTC